MTLIDAGARWLGIHIAATPLSVIFTFIPFQPLVSLIFIDLGVIYPLFVQSMVARLTLEKSSDRGEDSPRLGP